MFFGLYIRDYGFVLGLDLLRVYRLAGARLGSDLDLGVVGARALRGAYFYAYDVLTISSGFSCLIGRIGHGLRTLGGIDSIANFFRIGVDATTGGLDLGFGVTLRRFLR